jgi:hypothetical protein
MLIFRPEEAKERLLLHLINSSYHQLSYDEAALAVDQSANIEEKVHYAPQQPSEPPPTKRLRAQADDIAEAVVSRLGLASGSGGNGTETALATTAATPCEQDIVLRRQTFLSVLDSIKRASLVVRQAQRLAHAANRAYTDEAANLEGIQSDLQNILDENDTETGLRF